MLVINKVIDGGFLRNLKVDRKLVTKRQLAYLHEIMKFQKTNPNDRCEKLIEHFHRTQNCQESTKHITTVAPRRGVSLFEQLKVPHIRLPAYITRLYTLSISNTVPFIKIPKSLSRTIQFQVNYYGDKV